SWRLVSLGLDCYLLRARRERPCRRTAEERDDRAAVNILSAAWTDMPPMNSSSVASTDILFDMVGLFHCDSIPLNGRTAQLRLLTVGPAWVRQIEVEHFRTPGRAAQPLSGA